MSGKVEVVVGIEKGKVEVSMRENESGRYAQGAFDPHNAQEFGEMLAREAYRAMNPGKRVSDDFSYLAKQVRERLTDEMKTRMVMRVRTMLPSLLEKKDINFAANQIVDTIFSAIDPEGGTRL